MDSFAMRRKEKASASSEAKRELPGMWMFTVIKTLLPATSSNNF